MAVDEDILNDTIQSLLDKITINSTQRKTLQELYLKAKNISLVEIPAPTVEDSRLTKKVLPNDTVLGVEINPTRREEIYDQVISENAAL